MARKRKSDGSAADGQPVALQLSPERAFVLHLDARAWPPRCVLGRIEHVTSGRVARITSLQGLTAFLREVLAHPGPSPSAVAQGGVRKDEFR